MAFLFIKPFYIVVSIGKILLQIVEGYFANCFLVSQLKSRSHQIAVQFSQCFDDLFISSLS